MAQPIPGLNLQVNLILSSPQTSAIFDPKFKPPIENGWIQVKLTVKPKKSAQHQVLFLCCPDWHNEK